MKNKLLFLGALIFLSSLGVLKAQPTWTKVHGNYYNYGLVMLDNGYVCAYWDLRIILSKSNGQTGSYVDVTVPKNFDQSNNLFMGAMGNVLFLSSGTYNSPYKGDGGAYISTDYGTTWTAKKNGLAADTNIVAFHSLASGVMLAVVRTSQYVFKIYRTSNNGDDWTYIKTFTGQVDYIIHRSVAEAYLMSNDVLYKSTDNGLTWNVIYNNYVGQMVITSTGELIGNNENGVVKSVDKGITWTVVNATALPIYSPSAALITPSDTIYYGLGSDPYGVYYSVDKGLSWTECSIGLGNVKQIFYQDNFAFSKSGYLFASPYGDGLYRSNSPVTANTSVGISKKPEINESNIYPNPSKDKISIDFNSELKNASVQIFDNTGKEVKNSVFSGNKLVIELNDFHAGIYYIKITSEGKVVSSQKIVVQ